ncbi:MAG: glycosyltransferase [Gammaproteobacteria bacterium]|nr:glycosyltransferase [Gammaproteobacteria bacterium]
MGTDGNFQNNDEHESKSILFAIKTFPPNFTGAGLRAYRMMERLHCKYGLCFRVLCTENSHEKDNNNNNYLSVKRIPLLFSNSLLFPFSAVLMIINIFKYLKKYKDDISIIHYFSFGLVNRIIMMINIIIFKKKTILEITQDGDDDPESLLQKGVKNILLRRWTLYLLRKIDYFTVQSKFSYDSCISVDILKSKIWHRPNPVDEKIFGVISFKEKECIKKKLDISNKFVLLNVGLIQPRKNQLFLCECFKQLKDNDAVLLLIGPTKNEHQFYEDEIIDYINSNGLAGRVKLLGHKENIHEYMIAADVLVFSSTNEGFCNVLPESAMSGLPIISLFSNGYYPYVTNIIGKMFNESETNAEDVVESFAVEVLSWKGRCSSIDREKIRQYALSQFSSEIIDEGYKDIYESFNT